MQANRHSSWPRFLVIGFGLCVSLPVDGAHAQNAIFSLAVVPAQEDKSKTAETDEKAAADKKAAEEAAKNAGDDKAKAEEGDVISFGQAKVTAQMTELEQRMFRLSEGLKELEPENASRLMLGLKFAREELILLQMQQTEQLLSKVSLAEAALEEKQLLAKLDRLKQLLLSDDLDFQLRLERLRLTRQVVKQLEVAIKEEDREQKQSKEAAEATREVARLKKKRVDLAELITRQTGHVDAAETLSKAASVLDAERKQLADLGSAQESTQNDTKALAASDAAQGKPSQALGDADKKMGAVLESLKKESATEALTPAREALDVLKKELDEAAADLKKREAQIASEKFAAMRKDQSGNRQFSDRVTDMVRGLGENGSRALGEMIRAGGSMQSAEGALGQQQAGPASTDQESALKSLKLAREELLREEQQLLAELHGEVRKRVIESITAMIERQVAIRETTTGVSAQVEKGSRQAIATVVGLANGEGEIIAICDDILSLVEETGFGIALPSTLRVIRREMQQVKGVLASGKADEPVIAAEAQIEQDLKDLLTAMQQMPDTPKQPGKPRKGSRDQERELNRLIAELKMVRLLQIRVNGETVTVDVKRPAEIDALAAELREQIEEVGSDQDHVRETTERLSIERGQELLGP